MKNEKTEKLAPRSSPLLPLKHHDERNAAADLVVFAVIAAERAVTVVVAGVIIPDFRPERRFRGHFVMGRQGRLPEIATLSAHTIVDGNTRVVEC